MHIDKTEHKKVMLNILASISSHPLLSTSLGFKGGTCCYFLYELDRFSVDLDFDLLQEQKQDEILSQLDKVLKKHGETKKEGNVFSRKVKYHPESSTIKIDISNRFDINKLNTYEVKDIVSAIPFNILDKKDIFAHKLVALEERYADKTSFKTIANRDLYDIYFFFEKKWNFNPEIIKLRTGKTAIEYLRNLKIFIEKKVDEKKILEGLGSLLDEKKRHWAKKNLKKEVIKKLAIQIEAMGE